MQTGAWTEDIVSEEGRSRHGWEPGIFQSKEDTDVWEDVNRQKVRGASGGKLP